MSTITGWSQRTIPVVRKLPPDNATVNPFTRAKLPPLVIGQQTFGIRGHQES
jgi:hypothetical protein